jgi:hypothetical protein
MGMRCRAARFAILLIIFKILFWEIPFGGTNKNLQRIKRDRKLKVKD